MNFRFAIRRADAKDVTVVSDILSEAARWLAQSGRPLWQEADLQPDRVTAEMSLGGYFIAESDGKAVGTFRFQLKDELFWPEASVEEAAYLHRLAIRRAYAGTGLSTAMLSRAVDETRSLGRRYLRLDCAARPRLCAVYETFGFRHRDHKQIGPYFVSRYEYDVCSEVG